MQVFAFVATEIHKFLLSSAIEYTSASEWSVPWLHVQQSLMSSVHVCFFFVLSETDRRAVRDHKETLEAMRIHRAKSISAGH